MPIFPLDADRDLVLERVVSLPRELIWQAWTTPEILMKWFCPRPWTVSACEIDLTPGGIFHTVMQSPEGEAIPNAGCILEAVVNTRLVFTDSMLPGFRPSAGGFMTGIILLEDVGAGTKYTAIARHKDAVDCAKHAEMGFHAGWSTALDQLLEVMG